MAWFRRSTIRPVIGRPHYRFSTTRPVRVVIWWCGSVGRPHDRLKVDHITSSEPNDWFVWLYGRVVPYICSSVYSYGPLITCRLSHDFNPQQPWIKKVDQNIESFLLQSQSEFLVEISLELSIYRCSSAQWNFLFSA